MKMRYLFGGSSKARNHYLILFKLLEIRLKVENQGKRNLQEKRLDNAPTHSCRKMKNRRSKYSVPPVKQAYPARSVLTCNLIML
jgi:hypothetical protein